MKLKFNNRDWKPMPTHADLDRLRSLKTLPQLIAYLRDDLDWPVDQDAVEDDVTYDYAAEELGFDAATAVHIKEIKQLRPLDSRQPWGVFWVNFEKKRLPVVMLRRILGNLVLKKRTEAKKVSQRAFHSAKQPDERSLRRDAEDRTRDACAPIVEKVSWTKNTVWLDKSQTTGFKGVREDVWNFHIGGYQVCEKWLKDRKGRNLSAADRTHYQKIVIALSETIRLMAEIDAVIAQHGGWPIK